MVSLKKLNNYQKVGMGFMVILLFSTPFGLLPDIVEGFCAGMGILLLLLGNYANNRDVSKIRTYKLNLLKRCFGKW